MGDDAVQREVLPIPDRRYPGLITYDARDPDSRFAAIAPVRPPEGAPNVLLVLLDDVGGGLGKGGTASLFVDGQPAGTGRVERTCGYLFSLDETSDVGADSCSPVCDDYPPGTANAFTGTIKFLRVDLGDDSHDHLVDPEIKAQLALTRQ